MAQASRQLDSFARELLLAFNAAECYAGERGLTPELDTANQPSISLSWISARRSSSYINNERTRRQLRNLYTCCIRYPVDELSEILSVKGSSASPVSRQTRIEAALSNIDENNDGIVSAETLIELLNTFAMSFREHQFSLGRSLSKDKWFADWDPDWCTQNLVWTLLKKLGSTNPPSEALTQPYQQLKEAAFACLFHGEYLRRIRKKCSFRQSLLQYIPVPGKWEADLTWVGTSFFISMPIANLTHSWDDGYRVAAFWSSFVTVFILVAVSLLFLFASYRSRYSNSLLDRAAKGTIYDPRYTRPLSTAQNERNVSNTSTNSSTSPSGSSVDATDVSEIDVERNSEDLPTESVSEQEVTDFDQDSERNGSLLQLYQASMFVERIYGSKYMDESWMLGMTEKQLFDAIKLVIGTAGSLGRQTAAFSFTSLAIATRGTPDPEKFANGKVSAAVRGSQVTFAIFSLFGAVAFASGMMSAMLSDLILRQMAFTQVESERKSHAFVEKFAFFIRLIGGLNNCAGMSLFTGVVVLLLSIFRVHPVAVIPFATAWLVGGSLIIESFFTKFHFWNMSEIISEVGKVIDDPDIQSPSPIAGTLQLISRRTRKGAKNLRQRFRRHRQTRK